MALRLLTAVLAIVCSADDFPDALARDDTCNDASCGIELRQLRGQLRLEDPDDDDDDDDDGDEEPTTCATFLARSGCDETSEVARDPSTHCGGDECSDDTCCIAKASCDFFTVMGGCANLAAPENATDKVWAAKTAKLDEDLYCASSEQDVDSCGEACCELKPCTKCSGQQYLVGCKAGFTGRCVECPKESSCATGEQQTCGEGKLSSCFPCTNGPDGSHYTSNSMTGECKWECDADYYQKADGTCHICPKEASCAAGEQQTCGAGNLSSCFPCTNKPDGSHYTSSSMTGECKWDCDADYYQEADSKCYVCPKESSCAAGEQQTCGKGVLSSCFPCTNNKPNNSHYTSSSMTGECKWGCDLDYNLKADGHCHPATCNSWPGHCDSSHVRNAPTVECYGACDAADCCTPKATCQAYLGNSSSAAAACASVKEAAADGKVWAAVVAVPGETPLCKGKEADDASCQTACCTAQSCKACAGKQYTLGCEAGSIGTCTACPTNSSCAAGEYQPCGEGELGKCTGCSNGPENSVYTDTALENACPWECSSGYNKTGSACTPTCSVHRCPGKLVAIKSRSLMFQPSGHADEFCCQSAGCAEVSSMTAVDGCSDLANESECESKFVRSGNQHLDQLSGDTIYTPCKWDGTRCNWDTHQYRNCVF
eukprot:TRINITY_DN105356_c0_g1_i1.p1 TRINITY_DN105356_c0_g1~~TRINITY_DN105356_c0_g1_i1.p1  ORF type:complete len:680 (+),score=119.75 TRINITY_DN105356_c0_g1_i1:74-2041(+)